jgi:hypothetical protein
MVLTFLPATRSCFINESSAIDDPPKLFPMSTNVGSDPVVSAFIRWSVAVGGSEYALNKNEFRGLAAVISRGSVKML